MSPTKPPSKRAASSKPARAPGTSKPASPRRPARSRRTLVDAPPDKAFWVNFGPVIKNLRELRDALADGMSDEQFAHHVTGDRNDFASWVDHVLGDAKCAKALRKARSRAEALRVVAASVRMVR